MRLTDADVPQMLRQLTFLPLDQIKQIEIEHMKAPEKFVGFSEPLLDFPFSMFCIYDAILHLQT